MMMRSAASEHESDVSLFQRLMTLMREQLGLTLLLVMSLIGLGISIYLTIVHYDTKVSLLCTTGGVINCQSVTSSAYSTLPGTSIPVTIPGMLWFIALGVVAGMQLWAVTRDHAEAQWLRPAMLLWTAVGLLFVLYLVYCEIVLVQRICEWCTAVHLLTLAAFVIALTRWQRRDEPVMPASQRVTTRQPNARASAARARPAQQALSRRTRRTLSQRPPATR